MAEAETRLKLHKADRHGRGELERGELRGIKVLENPGKPVASQQLILYWSPQPT
jgi:hypothetical protein